MLVMTSLVFHALICVNGLLRVKVQMSHSFRARGGGSILAQVKVS